MEKKKYINPNLRKAKLYNLRYVTKTAFEAKTRICRESALSGAPCWMELITPTVIKDIFEAMTEAEFQAWLDRLYPDPKS